MVSAQQEADDDQARGEGRDAPVRRRARAEAGAAPARAGDFERIGAHGGGGCDGDPDQPDRSEEHTSELQSLMRISYAVFCLKKKKQPKSHKTIQLTDNDSKAYEIQVIYY